RAPAPRAGRARRRPPRAPARSGVDCAPARAPPPPHAEWSAYAASKHGLKALADSLRQEEHANGVRVTSVYPGRTASPMQAKVHQQEGKEYDPSRWIDPESVATTILMAVDLPRDAEVNDLTVRPGR
ncbi:SDR family NAD(P)-dependent oxidoreductase, partial [Streptomyces sp. NPDC059153]|uniref:SDR family NAD(P)-dependent oxidoreductase n=1 Tax=Streptomyces sp. NPDC059153 TaxID=3346743 RepID=UPI003673A21B